MKNPDIFKKRTAVLIRKHKKDEVIFPIFDQTGMSIADKGLSIAVSKGLFGYYIIRRHTLTTK